MKVVKWRKLKLSKNWKGVMACDVSPVAMFPLKTGERNSRFLLLLSKLEKIILNFSFSSRLDFLASRQWLTHSSVYTENAKRGKRRLDWSPHENRKKYQLGLKMKNANIDFCKEGEKKFKLMWSQENRGGEVLFGFPRGVIKRRVGQHQISMRLNKIQDHICHISFCHLYFVSV